MAKQTTPQEQWTALAADIMVMEHLPGSSFGLLGLDKLFNRLFGDSLSASERIINKITELSAKNPSLVNMPVDGNRTLLDVAINPTWGTRVGSGISYALGGNIIPPQRQVIVDALRMVGAKTTEEILKANAAATIAPVTAMSAQRNDGQSWTQAMQPQSRAQIYKA